jgi:hypothetical protein
MLVTNVTAGTHNLTLNKSGYQNKTVQVEVEAGEQKVLSPITLSPGNATGSGKGSIYVSSVPTNATIFLDGVNRGLTNRLVTNITAGSHNLTLTKSGYQAKTVQVEVEAGEQEVLSPITLTQGEGSQGVNGSIYVASIPSNATILVDNVTRGYTNQLVTNIPAGTHNLTITKIGYQATTIWVDIVAGVSKILGTISLSRI